MYAVLFVSGEQTYAKQVGDHVRCGQVFDRVSRNEAIQLLRSRVEESCEPRAQRGCAYVVTRDSHTAVTRDGITHTTAKMSPALWLMVSATSCNGGM